MRVASRSMGQVVTIALNVLAIACVSALAGTGSDGTCANTVEVRGKWRVKNNTGRTASDFHFYMFQNDRPDVEVLGATAGSASFSTVGVTLGTDNGTGSPPPGNHGAQVDMTGGSIADGQKIDIDLSLCMNKRNNVKIKDVKWTFETEPFEELVGRAHGFRVFRAIRGGSGGNLTPSGGGKGAQEDNGGMGNWMHIVCIENDSAFDLQLERLKLLASMTFYNDIENDIDWDSIDGVVNTVNEPPVIVPAGTAWYYFFETTGSYFGGHVYLNYSLGDPPLATQPFDEPSEDADVVFGDHPVEQAEQDGVLAGDDWWTTAAPSAWDFSLTPIPAGFFGPGSDPFEVVVPLASDPQSGFGVTDTIIRRLDTAHFPAVPSSDTVDIEIVQLNLVSTAPILVTSDNGQGIVGIFELRMEQSEVPSQGTMSITKDRPDGGTFTLDLPVQPRFVFDDGFQVFTWDTGNPPSPTLPQPPVPMQINGGPHPWVADECAEPPVTGSFFVRGPNFMPVPNVSLLLDTAPPGPGQWTLFADAPPEQDCDCVAPDNGSGTIDPPAPCNYIAPHELVQITNGLPLGSSLQANPTLRSFVVTNAGPGGALGGTFQEFTAILTLDMEGTNTLAGVERVVQLPVRGTLYQAPTSPGAAVQSFASEIFELRGQLFGDPDFDVLRVSAGSGVDGALPSPGQTTLTRLGPPGSDFVVDSFFDITYRIEFVGAPGGALEGFGGTTDGTVRIEQTGDAIPAEHFCVAPDNGGGTIDHPAACPYFSFGDAFRIVLGQAPLTEFLATPNNGIRFDVQSVTPGGILGGEVELFHTDLALDLGGTGGLIGFEHTVCIPVVGQIHTAARTPGDPVQQFGTQLFSFNAVLNDDEVFDLFRITAGAFFGMPSNGQTRLTRVDGPGSEFIVDSFFDISYEIEFISKPGSVLGGATGESTGTLRVSQEDPLSPEYPFGLGNKPVCAGESSLDGSGQLVVSNIGSSGLDGVSIALGEAQGAFVELDPGPLGALPTGSSTAVRVNPTDDDPTIAIAIEETSGGRAQVAVDVRDDNASTVRVQTFSNGVLTDTEDFGFPLPASLVVSNIGSSGQDGVRCDYERRRRASGLDFVVDSFFDINFSLNDPSTAITGHGLVTADQLRIIVLGSTCIDTQCPLKPVCLDILGKRNEPLTIHDEALRLNTQTGPLRVRLKDEAVARSLSGSGGALTISNIGSSGLDGVRLAPLDPDNNELRVELEPLLVTGTQQLALSAVGTFDASTDSPLGELTVGHNGVGLDVATDYTPLGATQTRVEVYSGGGFVGSAVVATNALAATVGDAGSGAPLINGCGKLSPSLPTPPCFVLQFDRPALVTPNGGSPLTGDELRLLADNAAGQIETLDRLEICGTSLGRLTMIPAAVAPSPLPVVLSAASIKQHSLVGSFAIDLGISPAVGDIECRANGPTIVDISFDRNITPQDGVLNGGDEVVATTNPSGAVSVDSLSIQGGSVLRVQLSNVTSPSCLSLVISGIATDLGGGTPGAVMATTTLLQRVSIGDAGQSGKSTSADVNFIRSQAGAVDGSNFHVDITADGVIDEADVSLAKAHTNGHTASCP